MKRMNFYPGIAGPELRRLARERGKSQAAILRELVRAADIPALDFLSVYDELTALGREFKAMAEAGIAVRDLIRLARRIGKAGAPLPGMARPVSERRSRKIRQIGKAGGPAATYYPEDGGERLRAISERAGLGKAATLRALILGIPLPDRQAELAAARLSQLGGLVRHFASPGKPTASWKLYQIGADISAMARDVILRQFDDEIGASSVEEA